MARVLRPGGGVAIGTWSALDRASGYAAMVDLLLRLFGDAAAEDLTAPFVLGDPTQVHDIVATAFPNVRMTTLDGVARFESIEARVHTDIRAWTLADMIDDDQYRTLLTEAQETLARFTDDAGRVAFPAPALIATATKEV